ncbi:SREBP regulating gene protein-like isoform X3 [Choloepus didactylus]|uniref:SREBP regulating gene protein-like isoform X3 n=1 Tax=Choloepus didactylus TaxID=27675 RepID=UPI00189DCE10|nr:SREBP regulating gene protein-like isoform X3 [Choloepus didactylus]
MVNLAAMVWRRLLRKRWVLALVFGLSLVYFLTSTFKQQLLLERFLSRAAMAFQNLFMAVEYHSELCLAKCRTSFQSVQHENTYRDPIAKYCYGESPPELFPA